MITIHGVFGSPFVRTLRIALEEKGLDWAWAPFQIGQHKQQPYLSLHPFGKIPAITDGDFSMHETNAMLRYIDRKASEPALLPADPMGAARADQILCIVDNYLWPGVKAINFNRLIAPMLGVPPDEAAVAASIPAAEEVCAVLASHLDGRDFLVGDRLTLADIACLPHLDMLSKTPEGKAILAKHPNLVAWLAAMAARPSVAASAKPPAK